MRLTRRVLHPAVENALIFVLIHLLTLHVSASPPSVEDITVPAAVGLLNLHRSRTKVSIPPAGRDNLYRPGILQPWDFPPEISNSPDTEWDHIANNPRHTSIMGPAGFWTEAGTRQHYEAIRHLRFATELFPTPPPYEVWLKEQQMLRMIKMHEDTIKQQLLHRGESWTVQDALAWELNRAEQLIIFRQFQISVVLKYANLDPLVREYETKMYRFWAGFLEHFRHMDVAFFDRRSFIEQLEGSNKMLEAKLENYLRAGGQPTDSAYRQLWNIYQDAQRSLSELKSPIVPVERPADFERVDDHARHSPSAHSARRPSSSGAPSELEAHDLLTTHGFDKALDRLEHLKLVEKVRPPV